MASHRPQTTAQELIDFAQLGKIELARAGALNKQTLGIKNAEGVTLLELIAENGQIHLVPKEHITAENIKPLLASRLLHHLASQGTLLYLPGKLLTLASLTKQDAHGWTPLHAAAINGFFDQVPAQLLTEEAMTLPTERGVTPLHLLLNTSSWEKFLEKSVIPFLNEKTLFLECQDYSSPILRLAERGKLSILPSRLRTEAILLRKNSNGFSAISESAVQENIHDLPSTVLTFKNLKNLISTLCANRTWPWIVRTEALICMTTEERRQWRDVLLEQANNSALTNSTRKDLTKTAQEIARFTHLESAGAWSAL